MAAVVLLASAGLVRVFADYNENTSAQPPGVALGDALTFLDNTAMAVLPAGAQTSMDGQSREFKEAGASMYVAFVLALVFLYLVLAAQFESFVDPFVIMLSVPLAVTGALLSLKLTGNTLNVYSQIGMVMLVGLIAKNGILIVEFANQLREQGRAARDAVMEAAGLRLRPILMTTAAMILGAIPLALAHGAWAESRQQIGWVIVGGLLLGTLLTLFVIPTAYTLLARQHRVRPRTGPPTLQNDGNGKADSPDAHRVPAPQEAVKHQSQSAHFPEFFPDKFIWLNR